MQLCATCVFMRMYYDKETDRLYQCAIGRDVDDEEEQCGSWAPYRGQAS